MRPWWSVSLLLGMLVSGCAAPSQVDAPMADAGASQGERTSETLADAEFSGVLTAVTTVNAAGIIQTDYFHDGDAEATVEEGATELRVIAEFTGAAPSEWQMCVTQGDPHDGVCTVGSSRLEALVNGTALVDGAWSPWFFLPDGPVPASAGAAVEIRWTATVLYA